MPLAQAWEIVVEREPEWDDYDRAEALAYEHVTALRCRNCGQSDSVVPEPLGERLVTWGDHDGRQFSVMAFRCLACASRDVVDRDFHTRQKDVTPAVGQATAADGRIHVAIERTEVARG